MAEEILNENKKVVEKEVKAVKETKPKKTVILKNVAGEDVNPEDYFYSTTGKGVAPETFNSVCGMPVIREDLIECFNSVFDPKYNILFYRSIDKEVYVVIIPLKYSTNVSKQNESVDGDFQKHAISFISEGSVNIDTLKMKLKRILPFVKFSNN